MYLSKIPAITQQLYPSYKWRVKTEKKHIYLTFDDGPTPEITDWVMGMLKQYNAKATFFVLGKNVASHPRIVHRLLDEGHVLGNHTHTHPNGWETSLFRYLLDFKRAEQAIKEYTGAKTRIFRPPYGRITKKQAALIQRSHQIVMMDVMPGDFDVEISAEKCLERILKHTQPGSIICLHDSLKAWPHMSYVLPRILGHFSEAGYTFRALNPVPDIPKVVR